MKRKGFTLIELLAVIVILAVIVLITATIITKVVENSRKNAAKNSALNYLDAVEKYVMYHDVDDTKYPYDLKDNTWNIVDTTTKEISLLNLIPSVKAEEVEVPPLNDFIKVRGSKPTSGTITIDNKGKITNVVMTILNYNITCDSSTSCNIEGKSLNEKETKITNIKLSEDATIEEGDSHTFTATIEPNDADTNTITWCSSSDTVISEATEQGRCETGEYEITTCYGNTSCEVTGESAGNTTITVKSNNISGSTILTVEKAILWLYDEGNEYNDMTNGWGQITDFTNNNYSKSSSVLSITKNTDNIFFSISLSAGTCAAFGTLNQPIRIDKYNHLYIDYKAFEGNGNHNALLSMSKNNSDSDVLADGLLNASQGQRKVLDFDISDYVGDYYIFFELYTVNGDTGTFRIYKMWLE